MTYQWMISSRSGNPYGTSGFYETKKHVQAELPTVKILQRLDYTGSKIEVK